MMDRSLHSLRPHEAMEMTVLRSTRLGGMAVVEPLCAARRVEDVAGRVVVPCRDVAHLAKGLRQHVQSGLGQHAFAEGDFGARAVRGYGAAHPGLVAVALAGGGGGGS